MYTYIIYIGILVFGTFFAYIAQNTYKTNKKLYYLSIFLSFLVLYIPAAIRYDIGEDYHNYANYYEVIKSGAIVLKEPLYILLNELIAYLDIDFHWFFVFTSFLIYFFFYKALPKESLAFGVFLFMYMFYFASLDVVRQIVAISIAIYAFKYFFNIKTYFFIMIIVTFIHFATGLVTMAVYPLVRIRFNRYLLLVVIVFIFVTIIKTDLPLLILTKIGEIFPKYAWYVNSMWTEGEEVSSGLGVLFRVVLILGIVFFQDKMTKIYPQAYVLVNMTVLYFAFYALSTKIHIFGRVTTAFAFYYVFALLYMVKMFKGYGRIFIIALIVAVYTLFYVKSIDKNKVTEDKNKSSRINPYQTIFERD